MPDKEQVATARFPLGLTSAAEARRFVAASCSGRATPAVVDIAVLLTSELATNAVVHVGSAVTVVVEVSEAEVRISVSDEGPGAPSVRPAGEIREGGRGLVLVSRLSTSWGTTALQTGKTVWFALDGGAITVKDPQKAVSPR